MSLFSVNRVHRNTCALLHPATQQQTKSRMHQGRVEGGGEEEAEGIPVL